MVAAYIFIVFTSADLHPGITSVLHEVRAQPNVKQAHILYGPTDCIAYAECHDDQALRDTVWAIRDLRGVADTDTRQVAFE